MLMLGGIRESTKDFYIGAFNNAIVAKIVPHLNTKELDSVNYLCKKCVNEKDK